MDLLTDYPYWLLKNGLQGGYPSLSRNKRTEIVVMGAGITGALIAWHLTMKGFQVIVVDKRHVGMGSTSASTALLQYEIDTPLHKLATMVGERYAARSYQLCVNAIYDLEKINKEIGADVGFERKESFQFASLKKDVKELQMEYAIRKRHGIKLTWLDNDAVLKKFRISAPAGLLSRDGAQVDAYRLTHALLKQSQKMGALVFDTTEIIDIDHARNGVVLTSHEDYKISAKHLVIAAGYESQKYIPKKVEELNSTYVILSEPLSTKRMWYKNCLIWETATPYLYLRTTDDNRIVVGGKDDRFYNPSQRKANMPQKVKALEKSFKKLFPSLPFKTDFQWSGAFAATKDGLPFIGSIRQRPSTSFALGFGGNGITFSVIAARIIADNLMGKINKDAPIFAFDR